MWKFNITAVSGVFFGMDTNLYYFVLNMGFEI